MSTSSSGIRKTKDELRHEILSYKRGKAVIGVIDVFRDARYIVRALRSALREDVKASELEDQTGYLTESVSLIIKHATVIPSELEEYLQDTAGNVRCTLMIVNPKRVSYETGYIMTIKKSTGHFPRCAILNIGGSDIIEQARNTLNKYGITDIYEVPRPDNKLSDEEQMQYLGLLHGCLEEGDKTSTTDDQKKICTNPKYGSTGPEFPQEIKAAQGPSGGQILPQEPKETIDHPLLDDKSSKPQGDVASGGMDQHSEEESHKITADLDGTFEDLSLVPGEENVKPTKMECRESIGQHGGELKLDSFGIVLEIPSGAIDCEAPQDISLRVLTDTPNLGNSNTEMSVCFGVQCLAPDDLVLKKPVTYTIPHCAVIKGDSSVEAILYTGEGEYSPGADVKERSMLSRSGQPSWTFTEDVLKLKMNHFSWAMIKLLITEFFYPERRMCCRPFKEKNLALQKTPVILHAHVYIDVPGNSEVVEGKEGKENFIPAHMEQQILIREGKGDLKMTCYEKETVIGGPAVVSLAKLTGKVRICEPFLLNFTNQPDIVAVSLKVGQNMEPEVHFLFRLNFSTPHRRERASPQDPVEPDGDGYYMQTMQQANPSQDQLDPEQNYKMEVSTKGHMFIFNMRIDRQGSDVDMQNIKHVFKEIGFKIETHSDLTAKQLKEELQTFVESPCHKGMCSAVFFLMGHGNETGIECKCKQIVTSEFIKKQIRGINSMKGKPKMIFFHWCRGEGTGKMEKTDQVESDEVIAAKSDVFIAHATTYGNKAYRHRRKGTWFIQKLCGELLANAHASDLSTMLDRVSKEVGKMGSTNKSQCVEVTKQGVRKNIYFLPKYPQPMQSPAEEC